MRLLITLPNTNDPEQAALCFRDVLRGVVNLNRRLMRESRVPPLSDSGVVFQPEPFERNLQWDEVPDCVTLLKRGFADCAPLVCWRVAELQEGGELAADIIIYWRASSLVKGHKVRKMHAQVRRASGEREDPSRLLGMVSATSD